MLIHLRPALVLLLLFSLLCGVAYPLAMTGLTQALFPQQASGSLIERDGKIIGSWLIGQSFSGAHYFHGRPSATVPAYNAAASSGSNAGPSSRALHERLSAELSRRRAENPQQPVPVDLLTASGSGLDPHLNPDSAHFQVPRVARARGLDDAALHRLVQHNTQPRALGLLGEPVVNVLALNLALDALQTP